MFSNLELENIVLSIQRKKASLADQIRIALRQEGVSRIVADLTHQLRETEQDEAYLLSFQGPQTSLLVPGRVARHMENK